MRNFCFALLMLVGMHATAQDINFARSSFDECVYQKNAGERFLDAASDNTKLTSTVLGYKGAILMIMAKHYISPWTKLGSFNQGRALLEDAIKKDAGNLELIYIRFSIQTNSPSFLGYQQFIETDKNKLLEETPLLKDKILRKRITDYLLKSSYISDAQKAKLNTP